jgi:hypothetical protein
MLFDVGLLCSLQHPPSSPNGSPFSFDPVVTCIVVSLSFSSGLVLNTTGFGRVTNRTLCSFFAVESQSPVQVLVIYLD